MGSGLIFPPYLGVLKGDEEEQSGGIIGCPSAGFFRGSRQILFLEKPVGITPR